MKTLEEYRVWQREQKRKWRIVNREKIRVSHREWERKAYALKPRVRVFTPEQKTSRHEYYLKNKTKQIAAINAKRKAAGPGSRRAEHVKYYSVEANRQKMRESGKLWAQKNRDKRKLIDKRCKTKHREKYLAAGRKHHWLNRDRVLAYNKRNRERFRVLVANWKKANPEKVKAMNRKRVETGQAAEGAHRRRARARANGIANCAARVKFLRLMPLCQYCFTSIGKATIDHIIPLSRGGAHYPNNLVASCPSCNSQKHNKLLSEWVGRRLEEAA